MAFVESYFSHQQGRVAAAVAHHLDAGKLTAMTKAQRASNRLTRGVTGDKRGGAWNFLARFGQ